MNSPFSTPRLIWILVFILLMPVAPGVAKDNPSKPADYQEKGLSSKTPLTEQEQVWLDRKHTVRVRLSHVPPYHISAPDPQGISVDYLKLIGKRFGINFSFVSPPGGWQDALNDMTGERKYCDLLMTMTKTPEREKLFSLTQDYLSSPLVIINRTGTDFISQMKDLNGRNVALEKGFVVKDRLEREYPQIRIVICDTSLKALQSVAGGTSDAYIGNLAIASYLINNNGLKNLRVAAPSPFGNQNLAMAVRKDWPELASIINKALDAMTEAEESEIRNRWLSIRYEHVIDRKQLWSWVAGLTALFTLILAVTIFWNKRLKREIDLRNQSETMLRIKELEYRSLIENLPAGIVVHSPDTSIQLSNPMASHLLGLTEDQLLGKTTMDPAWCFIGADGTPTPLPEYPVNRVLSSGKPLTGQVIGICRPDRAELTWVLCNAYPVCATEGRLDKIVVSFADITDRIRAEEQLQKTLADLSRSNQELERFAYVASHDLQEPVRMVVSYAQLLELRYGEQLDGTAREFIGYLVDGARRMHQMINDLLAYSRVGTLGSPAEQVDAGNCCAQALGNLKLVVEQTGAEITVAPLPTLAADGSQLVQLFQNLVGNSLKFRGEAMPLVSIRAEELAKEWRFAVTDNGIGLDTAHSDRIFRIFQRLHGYSEYPGTGIGLAVCKRIVERHGGRIWVESTPGAGATFFFTIPKVLPEELTS
jgi:signal transduction histidine kinase/ABC-type amino acid transport substrate-binding protein